MKITIDLPESYTFGVPTSKTESYVIETAKLSPAIFAQVFSNGLKQKTADSVADKEKYPDVAAKKAGVLETVQALYDGDWGRERGSGPETPESRAKKLAIKKLQETDDFKPAKLKDEATRKRFAEQVAIYAAKPEYLAAAKAQLELEASLASIKL